MKIKDMMKIMKIDMTRAFISFKFLISIGNCETH